MHLMCNLRPQHRPRCSASEVLESMDRVGEELLIKGKLSQFNLESDAQSLSKRIFSFFYILKFSFNANFSRLKAKEFNKAQSY